MEMNVVSLSLDMVYDKVTPLSPFLFLLCAEALSCFLKKVEAEGSIEGVQVAVSSPRISHLFFGDDIIFFAKATMDVCDRFLGILKQYEEASGQQVNLRKTVVTFSPYTPRNVRVDTKSVPSPTCGWAWKIFGFAISDWEE